MSTFEDSDHAPFASSLYACGRWFGRYSCNHTISVHGCADVFRRDENVRLPRFFRREKTIAGWMDRQFAGYEVSLGRQYVAVFPDPGDLSSVPSRLAFDATASAEGLRVGYIAGWMNEPPATDVDRAALEIARRAGMVPVEVTLPDWAYASLNIILFAEAAAAFEDLTLSHGVDALAMQVLDAWPNTFRQSRFLSAVDFVQADRLRRKVAQEMARVFSEVDLLLVPSLRDEILTITNFTGHPSLTLRDGFVEVDRARSDWAPDPARPLPTFSPKRRVPHGITLIGRLFDEGTVGRAGIALEREFKVGAERPPGFD